MDDLEQEPILVNEITGSESMNSNWKMANKVTPETGDVRKKVFFKEHSSSLDEDNSFINDPHYIDKFDLDGKTIIKKDYSFSDEDDEQISPNVKINGRMVGHLRDSM